MLRHTILALTLGLTLAGTGIKADEPSNREQNQPEAQQPAATAGDTQAPQAESPASPDEVQPNQAAPNAAPQDQAQPSPADPNGQPANPAPANPADPTVPQSDTAPANPPANPTDPNAPQPNQAPGQAAPANPVQPNPGTPDQAQPNQQPPAQNQNNLQQPDQNPNSPAQPAPAQPGQQGGLDSGSAGMAGTPLQEFLSQQVDEVGMLGEQMDVFRSAKRQDAVMAMYHMIRDHRLVADAAQNVLARRGDVSRPIAVSQEPMPQDPQEIIRQQIQHHEQALAATRQLLSTATTPEEQSIYQRATDVTNKHLAWLRAMDQGRQLQIGYFGPTVSLARIAGYREQATFGQPARQVRLRSQRSPSLRGWQSRRSGRGGTSYPR